MSEWIKRAGTLAFDCPSARDRVDLLQKAHEEVRIVEVEVEAVLGLKAEWSRQSP